MRKLILAALVTTVYPLTVEAVPVRVEYTGVVAAVIGDGLGFAESDPISGFFEFDTDDLGPPEASGNRNAATILSNRPVPIDYGYVRHLTGASGGELMELDASRSVSEGTVDSFTESSVTHHISLFVPGTDAGEPLAESPWSNVSYDAVDLAGGTGWYTQYGFSEQYDPYVYMQISSTAGFQLLSLVVSVPEPAAAVLLLGGLITIAARRVSRLPGRRFEGSVV